MLLIECLADSDCMAQGKSVKECLEDNDSCKELRTMFFLCKRGQVCVHAASRCSVALARLTSLACTQLDMRKRIKGNMPDDNVKEDE